MQAATPRQANSTAMRREVSASIESAPVSFLPLEAPGMDGDAWVVCTQKSQGKRRTVAHAYTAEHARLFAVAPEMLAALKLAASIIGHPTDAGSIYIAEVIAKAEGR